MKEWHFIILVIMGVGLFILLSYLLTQTLSFWWCNSIVIVINFIVSIYIILEKKKT